jgi:hypothetical protein
MYSLTHVSIETIKDIKDKPETVGAVLNSSNIATKSGFVATGDIFFSMFANEGRIINKVDDVDADEQRVKN